MVFGRLSRPVLVVDRIFQKEHGLAMDFSGSSVLCVGDLILDRFVYGQFDRISPEAPVPVLRLTRTTEMLGGVGNVANNVAALGGQAILVGLVGRDAMAGAIHGLLTDTTAISARLVETGRRPTICKTRYVASGQQVVRTDEEHLLPLDEIVQPARGSQSHKAIRSPDRSLQLDCVKSESLVIADQLAAVNTFPGLVHTARHITKVGCTRSSWANSQERQVTTV